jgi:pSer/pThr/pTyr-binding forkhead associated (FHA) protein
VRRLGGCRGRLAPARTAALDAESGGAAIEDLGSTNGTFVNETRVESPRPLRDGDLVHVGTVALHLPRVAAGTVALDRAHSAAE